MLKKAKNPANETLKVGKMRNKGKYAIYVTKNDGKKRVAHDDFNIDAIFATKQDAECYLQINALVLA